MSQRREEMIADARCCLSMMGRAVGECEYWRRLVENTMDRGRLTFEDLLTTKECVEAVQTKDYQYLAFFWYETLLRAPTLRDAVCAYNKLNCYLAKAHLDYTDLEARMSSSTMH